ncbi:MAG TPA: sigma-70 family RNA polymerase sigma factor [Mycobacteriales bacterium]|nr:sigma-70 family RNA polymerase sigma factor [Mycobacteriales bacterium]
MADVTDQALRAGRGDPAALAGFITATIADVRRYCAVVVDDQGADDLVQQTYLKAIRALPRYRGDAPAKAWLLGIARHTCVDEIRHRQRRRAVEQVGLIVDPPAHGDPFEAEALRDLLSTLEADRREAFVLTQVIGFSYEEAATAIGCPVGTVRSRVYRARADLVTALGAQGVASSRRQ